MSACLRRTFLTLTGQQSIFTINSRSLYYKFKRIQTPPLKRPKESPYIVGPYLKPAYLRDQYITDSIKRKHVDHINYWIYEPIEVHTDDERVVKLLLIEDVEGMGVAGQVVEANHRLGASRLVAMKKADYATEFALSWHQFGPRTFESASSALSPKTCRLLKNTLFNLPLKREIVIKPWHLSVALRLAGCKCPLDAIEEESITKEVEEDKGEGVTNVTIVKCIVKINNHEKVPVRFMLTGKS